MNWEAAIERRHAEAILELRILARQAREEIARKFAFFARSNGQKRRYERQRILRSRTV